MANTVVDLLKDLYYEGPAARALLLRIGYPLASIPSFHAADTFWPDVVLRLDRGVVVDGMPRLLAAMAAEHPGNPAVAGLAAEFGPAGPVSVLALFSDPARGSKIRIDEEARQLQQLRTPGALEPHIRYATRVRDIISALRDTKPRILHFAGHGLRDGRLVFADDLSGEAKVGLQRLADAIGSTVGVLDCVVLNSCYTGADAEAFRGVARAVAGSVDALPDDVAIAFARGFYGAVAAGEPAARAYGQGRAEAGLTADTTGLHFVTFGT
ncbi:MAG: CHAT domain-containing protein [Actinoplanes sp.]